MTDSKKSRTSASSPKFKRSEAHTKSFNPPNAVPHGKREHAQRYLYGGMLFPSRIIAAKDMKPGERDIK